LSTWSPSACGKGDTNSNWKMSGWDLAVNDKRIEFKFNYDRCEKFLRKELAKHQGDLKGMWKSVQAGSVNKSRGVMARIYEDVCERIPLPHIFVWIICSRDLAKVGPEDLRRICCGTEQRKYNALHPYVPEGGALPMVDRLLSHLQAERSFSLLKQDIPTEGDFPSTYHFRICDFV
jgi:hypothetical protein